MMSTIATQQDLKRLGLGEFRLGQTALLPWPAPDTSYAMGAGLARVTFAAMLATRFIDVPFAAVNDPSVGRFHLETSQTPARVLRVSAPGGATIQLFAVRGAHYA